MKGKQQPQWENELTHEATFTIAFQCLSHFVLLSELSANVRPGKSRDEHKESAKRTPIKSWKERPTPPQVRLFSLLLLQ